MSLWDFMQMDVYKSSECLEIVDKDGKEIVLNPDDLQPEQLEQMQVLDFNMSSEEVGLLEIMLDI